MAMRKDIIVRPGANCLIVMHTNKAKYTVKYCTVRFMTHCIAGEIGGVSSAPFGCSMTNTDTMTAVNPPYRARRATYRTTVMTMPNVRFSMTKRTSPSLGPCLHSHFVANGRTITNIVCSITE